MPLPQMKSKSGNVLGVYRFGEYTCMLVEKPEAIGPIKYFFMMIVTKGGSSNPTLVVTCEKNALQNDIMKLTEISAPENAPECFFCFFNAEGNHFIVDSSQAIPSKDDFLQKSFGIIRQKLGIEGQPNLVERSNSKFNSSPNRGYFPFGLEIMWAFDWCKRQLRDLDFGKIKIVILILLGIFSVFYLLANKNNFNDCVLDGMKGVNSDIAARAIIRACDAKHNKS